MRRLSPLYNPLASFLAAITLVVVTSSALAKEQGTIPLDELRTFAEVYNQIREGYVEEIDDSTLLEYAIQGMLMGLDPHSLYMTRDAFKSLQDTTKGEFSGCLLYTSPSPRDRTRSRMPSSA